MIDEVKASALHHALSGYTLNIVRNTLESWKGAVPGEPPPGSWVHFLGTGGNPINLIGQHRQTGGFLLRLGKALIYVDPGPGAIVHASRAEVDLSGVDAVFVSHGHTDHCGDAGVIIEAMCQVMSKRKGMVIAPGEVFRKGIISEFHQGKAPSRAYPGGPLEVVSAREDGQVSIKEALIRFVRAYHGDENYGFIMEGKGLRVGYTSDTGYLLTICGSRGVRAVSPWDPMTDMEKVMEFREPLKRAFSEVDVLIANVSYHSLFASRCLTAVGLAHLLRGSKVGLAIITHLDFSCLCPRDISEEMAHYVEAASGVNTIVARDNEVVPLLGKQGI